jgi:hypothetical protein
VVSIINFYKDEELRQLYDEALEKRKLMLEMLEEIDEVIDILENFFETGEYPEDLLDE